MCLKSNETQDEFTKTELNIECNIKFFKQSP